MKITVNGKARNVSNARLADLLDEIGLGSARVATAVNGEFVPRSQRGDRLVAEGDQLEILAPMQGG